MDKFESENSVETHLSNLYRISQGKNGDLKNFVFISAASKNLMKSDGTLCSAMEVAAQKYIKNTELTSQELCKQIKQVVGSSVRLETSGTLNFRNSLTPLHCGGDVCGKTESISTDDFDTFVKSYFPTTKTDTVDIQPNIRKISKNAGLKSYKKYTKNLPSKNEEAVFGFKTANDELVQQNLKKNPGNKSSSLPNAVQKRKLGLRRGIQSKFVSPLLSNNEIESKSEELPEEEVDERLRNIEPRMVELIRSEIMDNVSAVTWSDIAGLDFAKSAIQEAIIWPLLRPDLFKGLRRPPKGILLFGPPGTGKTLIGKCVASQSKSTFFSISASSLTSKWIGDGEKMVRALFTVARCHQPAVIFIDEVDSLLSQRSDSEHESSRRIKTEFLVQLDGATTDNEERLLVIGATNRPQELDEAARRRFVKRLHIPLPEKDARYKLVRSLMQSERHRLTDENMVEVARLSDGYSGADIRNLCSEASLGPIRSLDVRLIEKIDAAEVRPVEMGDFSKAFARVKSSVAAKDLEQYVKWDAIYGSGSEVFE